MPSAATAFLLAAVTVARAAGAGTMLTCAYPTSFVPFGVFGVNVSAAADPVLLSPDDGNLYFNAAWRPARDGSSDGRLWFSGDAHGAIGVYESNAGHGSAPPSLRVEDGVSLNDHVAWAPAHGAAAFTSTRAPPRPFVVGQGWAATYVYPGLGGAGPRGSRLQTRPTSPRRGPPTARWLRPPRAAALPVARTSP